MSKYVFFETIVPKIGQTLDYINLPVTNNEKAIGVVSHAEEVKDGYKLTLLMFKSVNMECIRDISTEVVKPFGISIG